MFTRILSGLVLLAAVVTAHAQPPGQRGGMGGGPHMGGGMQGPGGSQGQGPMGQSGQGMMGQPGMGMAGRGLDRNGDGLISREEVQQEERALQQMRERWEQADRNGDGLLDQSEFAAFQQQLREGAAVQ